MSNFEMGDDLTELVNYAKIWFIDNNVVVPKTAVEWQKSSVRKGEIPPGCSVAAIRGRGITPGIFISLINDDTPKFRFKNAIDSSNISELGFSILQENINTRTKHKTLTVECLGCGDISSLDYGTLSRMRSRSDKYCIECRDVGGKRKSLDNYKQEGFTILSVDNSIVNYRCNGCHSSISRGIAHAKRSEYIVCNKCNPYRVMGTKINTPDGRFDSMFEYKAYLKLVSILGKHNIIRQKPYDELFSTKTKHTADFYIPKLDLVLEVTTKYNKISDKYRNTAEWKMGISNKVIFAYTIAEVEDIVRTSLKEGDNSLQTAEMYYAASLSGDTNLQNVFRSGGDFHSAVAKQAFNLECGVDQVKDLYPKLRQGSKAVSFGVK